MIMLFARVFLEVLQGLLRIDLCLINALDDVIHEHGFRIVDTAEGDEGAVASQVVVHGDADYLLEACEALGGFSGFDDDVGGGQGTDHPGSVGIAYPQRVGAERAHVV